MCVCVCVCVCMCVYVCVCVCVHIPEDAVPTPRHSTVAAFEQVDGDLALADDAVHRLRGRARLRYARVSKEF